MKKAWWKGGALEASPLLSSGPHNAVRKQSDSEDSETDALLAGKPKKDWLGLAIVFFVLLLSESARGIVLPTLDPYVRLIGGNTVMLGYAVAAYSVGRLASTVFLGYLSTTLSYKKVLVGAVTITIAGNLMYSFAYFWGPYFLLASRFVTGFGAGTLSVLRAYVAHVTVPAERTPYMSLLGAVQFLGFAIMPGVGSLLTYFPAFYIGEAPFDKYTSSGYILAFFSLILLFVLSLEFKNPPKLPKPLPISADTSLPAITKDIQPISTVLALPPPTATTDEYMYLELLVYLALNFMARLVLGILETIGTTIYIALKDDEPGADVEAGFVFGGLGILGMCMLLFLSHLSKHVADFKVMFSGMIIMVLGSALLIGDIDLPRFIIGSGLIWGIGYPLAQTTVISMFSKRIGAKPQGTWMGWIGAMGALGRVVGPIVSGVLLDSFGQSASMIFGAAVSGLAVLTSFLLKLVPDNKL